MSTDVAVTMERKAKIKRGNEASVAIASVWPAFYPAALFEAFTAHYRALAEGISEGRQIAARYHELSQLSGAELARRGLSRQSIARVALSDQCSNSGARP